MHFELTVKYEKELILLPTHSLFSLDRDRSEWHTTISSIPCVKMNQYDLFFRLFNTLITIATEEPRLTRVFKEWCIQTFHAEDATVRGFAQTLVCMLQNNNRLEFDVDGLVVSIVLHVAPSELAIFVDGVDGCGKTTLMRNYLVTDGVQVTYELGSVDLAHLPINNTKKSILACRAESACATRDAHYAFAERWHSWSMLLRDCDEMVFSDRSWLSTLFYQGIEDTSIVKQTFEEGMRFTDYLYRGGRIPIYILLTNDPFTVPATDSLEVLLAEKHILYRMAATDAVDRTTIAQYDAIRPYESLDYYRLPIVGMHVNDVKRLLDRLVE